MATYIDAVARVWFHFHSFFVLHFFLLLLCVDFSFGAKLSISEPETDYFIQQEQSCPNISPIGGDLCRKPPELKLALLNALQTQCQVHLKNYGCTTIKNAVLNQASLIPDEKQRLEKIQKVNETFLNCSAEAICSGFDSQSSIQCASEAKEGLTKAIVSMLMLPVSVSQLFLTSLNQDRLCFENKG